MKIRPWITQNDQILGGASDRARESHLSPGTEMTSTSASSLLRFSMK
jgi:hypothetical protein